jgi:hypothetical protein
MKKVESGIIEQQRILNVLNNNLDNSKHKNLNSFLDKIRKLLPEYTSFAKNQYKDLSLIKDIVKCCGSYDEEADINYDMFDTEFNDSEIIKHGENIDEYYKREVEPYSKTTVMLKKDKITGCKIE